MPGSTGLYFIAVLPPEPIREEVRGLKLEMKRRFGAGHALKSPAHITLQMPFRMGPESEDTLLQLLEGVAAEQSGFTVDLSGFDCFAPRVLFIKITDHDPLQSLREDLREGLKNSGIPGTDKEPSLFHPHMTIATRDLSEDAFNRAWPEFREREFQARFRATAIWLLKHNGRHWDAYREVAFGHTGIP